MSEILCRWLNDDVQLSRKVDPNNFTECFSSGYLIGELLQKYGLQNDFELFSYSGSSEAKLNNFTRIEPTMALLDVKFDTNMAKEIISERPGMATRLLYQLFISLGKKTRMNLTGVAMETMRPSGLARLGVIESDIYKERLKTMVPRQVDLDFDELVTKYNRKQKEQEEHVLKARYEEEERIRRYQQNMRQQGLERSRQIRAKQDHVMAKIKEATVKIPKPPDQKRNGKTKKQIAKRKEIMGVYNNIDSFERSLKHLRASSAPSQSSDRIRDIDADIELFLNESSPKQPIKIDDYFNHGANEDYIQKIRQRLNEDANARREREKRRRRVLVEQLKAHEAQQDVTREDALVSRLMRQSQMERRIAVQLMAVRHEKKNIKENRLELEKQYTARRLQDFQDALEREAEMCRQAKLEYAADVEHAQLLHDIIAKERASKKYQKHYGICKEILLDMVDFSCKVGEYRELTERLLPPKAVREWKALFLDSKPLYNQTVTEITADEEQKIEIEESKQALLDDEDFVEYKNFVGEWIPQDNQVESVPNNNVLGFILKRLNNILYPPTPPAEEPKFPAFPIKACVVGKFFAGKSTAIKQIVATHRIESLNVDLLAEEALEAWKNQEMIEIVSTGEIYQINEDGLEKQANEPSSEVCTSKPHTASRTIANSDLETQIPDLVKETSNLPEIQEEKTDDMATSSPQTIESIESNTVITMQLSTRAKLGEAAEKALQKGLVISDSLLVDILVEHIQNLPNGTGWIIDGFPTTIQQAKLLEKALTGYSPLASPRKSATRDTKKGKKSKLAQDPQPPPEVKSPKSGLDVVILFDIEDDIVLRRSEGRTFDPETGKEYHEEFNPPPEGCYTGLQSKSKIQTLIDLSNDKEQAQLRLTTFQDNWSKLEKWFNRFNVLHKIYSNSSPEDTCKNLQHILVETMQRISTPIQEEKVDQPLDEGKGNTNEGVTSKENDIKEPSDPEPVTRGDISPDIKDTGSKPTTPKATPKKNAKRGKESPSPTKKNKNKEKKERASSPEKMSESGRRSGSVRSRSRSPRKSNSEQTIAFEEDVENTLIKEPFKPLSPEPGHLEWVYVEQPLDQEFVGVLFENWNIIEETYIASCKYVFRNVRHENETIYRYFYETREDFVQFLKRPDEKQIFVSQFQKEYNAFPEDMRSDEDAKAELHQRVDDVCDRLWDICDVRKDEAESERQQIMSEGWLQDHIGLLINHYISLVQMEVDRFQQTCKMLKDYYTAMEGGVDIPKVKLISEGIPEFTRLPLVDVPPTLLPETHDVIELEQSTSQLSTTTSVAARPTGKTPEPVEEKKGRIPLVPRRCLSGEASPSRTEKKKTTPRKDKASDEKIESPTPPADLDEKLLHDAIMSALHIIDVQNQTDLDDEEAESSSKPDKSHELTKTASKDKKGKKGDKDRKSPSKSKIQVQQTTPVQSGSIDDISEEEKEKLILQEKMRKEYKVAVQVEGNSLRTRVEAVRSRGMEVVKKLKEKAELTYSDMDKWLGKRYLEEIDSIEKMTEVIRQAIENECQLQDASILEDKEFYIDEDLHVFKTPTPPPISSPREEMSYDTFTCVQLQALCKHFSETAPSGMMNIKSFTNIILDLPSATIGSEALPERWLNITSNQLDKIVSMISIRNEYINWKEFLLQLSVPYLLPTMQDLMTALQKYEILDETQTGFISRDDYDKTMIWLDDGKQINDTDNTYDRMLMLKKIFFDIFSVETSAGQYVNYKGMLLYFVNHVVPLQGLLNALSIACSKLIPTDIITGNKEQYDQLTINVEVGVSQWLQIFNHGECGNGGDHRFTIKDESSIIITRDDLVAIYNELDYAEVDFISFNLLYQHPIMRDVIDACTMFQSKNIHSVFIEESENTMEEFLT